MNIPLIAGICRARLLVTALIAALSALPLSAITLTSADVIGYALKAEPASGAMETLRLQFFIDIANGGAGVDPGDGAQYFPVLGANVPLTLPTPAVLGPTITTGSLPVTLSTPYLYLMAKFGPDSVFYYLGGQTGQLESLFVPPGLGQNGNGLSHITLFNQIGGGSGVPDNGSTLALLGGAFAMVAVFRRKVAR